MTDEDLTDFLETAIDDSFDLGWTSLDAAKLIVSRMQAEGLVLVKIGPDAVATVVRELDRAIERIMGIEIEAMAGDNLAVLLCSQFDRDDDSEPDDNGWSQSATDAYDEIKREIAGLFVPVRVAIAAITGRV